MVVAERKAHGVNQSYSASDAVNFDAVVVAGGAQSLFNSAATRSWLYEADRPLNILSDAFRFGKTVGALRNGSAALLVAYFSTAQDGIYTTSSISNDFVNGIQDGLRTFKFLDRFALGQ